MKVAVYTIAKNEEQFVNRWYESAKDADYLLIADTGSTDGTVKVAKKLGINIINIGVSPWRFDTSRNASLAAIPLDIDYCIALDMDEILIEGWRPELEKAHKQKLTRPRYKYTWSWNGDQPGLQYGGDKIHTRTGYRWKHPVHEVLVSDRIQEIQGWIGLEIHHHPDTTKSRSQYMPLLKLSVEEDPWDDRNAYYYARELFFAGDYKEAAKEFKRHLSLPRATWKPERAASLRYLAKCEPMKAVEWLKQAIDEDPDRREARVELMGEYYKQEYWHGILANAMFVLERLTEKPLDYLCEEFAWGSLPYDLGALAAHHMKDKKRAIKWGTKAVELSPNEERLRRNLAYYQAN